MPVGGDGPDPDDPDPPRVFLDAMCGKLATYLRMCGYDAAYALDRGVEADDRVLSLAAAEDRTLITRDRELAARAVDALLLTERDVLDQLGEVAEAGLPVDLAESPTRCGACNGPVERVGPEGVDVDPDDRPEYVPDDVGASPATESDSAVDAESRPAWRCGDCGRWFWKGGHWESVADRLDGM
ncbi:Mut7-C RNAse domain-containing protein [Halorubrum sp. Boch-26]|uniref:Mut7-C RNAse domain-containing protein n=1 Tax=Halorubrum sp. Boch-26 TaxID=2994426 RepID=UPI0024692352|nr:Mut7-C RNAse domain-containing protein [Halorubrum sp. Boch-26]